MKRYLWANWQYFKYVFWHKVYVFKAGLKYKVSIWQLIIHDWTKFLPVEWFPYMENFYLNPPSKFEHNRATGTPFDYAWLHHQKYWPHHWQYFILTYDNDPQVQKALKMPKKYVREMVADWTGAGLAQGKPDIWGWYNENKHKMILHQETRELVERLLVNGRDSYSGDS